MLRKEIDIGPDGIARIVEREIDDAVIQNRRQRLEAMRAERNPPMIEGVVMLERIYALENGGAKWLAIQAAARVNADISLWVVTATARNRVDLASAETAAAKAEMVIAGLLTQAEADIVFAPTR